MARSAEERRRSSIAATLSLVPALGRPGALMLTVDASDVGGRLAATAHSHLGEKVRHVVLDCLLGEEHLLGDLAIRHPGGDVLDDGPLLLGELGEKRVILGAG